MGENIIPVPPYDADRIVEGVRQSWRPSRQSPYPSMVQGTFNCNLREFQDVAAVIGGFKPMAIVSLRDRGLTPEEHRAFAVLRFMIGVAKEKGFQVKSVEPLHPSWRALGAKEWFIGKPEAVDKASKSWLWIQAHPRSGLACNRHRIIGECLGIPKLDIDHWVSRLAAIDAG